MYLCQLLPFKKFYTKLNERAFGDAGASHYRIFSPSKGSHGNPHEKKKNR
jgi:hypothetical protein